MSKKCVEEFCYNDAPNGRLCNKHHIRKWRTNNVIRSCYNRLKQHAVERFITFEVTWEYWKQFCERTKYHELKGTGPDDMSIDRPDSLRGYADDNISMKTVRANTLKQHNEDKVQRIKQMVEQYKSEGAPF